MTPERWAKVSEVLERAMQLAPEHRAGFLDSVCASDPALRSEVASLLSANADAPTSFMSAPPSIELSKGSRLGNYEIQELIGAGGMGEVYSARDLKLRRNVAIKLLPPFATFDPERLRRFEHEALAVAALNHPNVLAIYHFGEHERGPYLVSELLEGETLRQELSSGPLPLPKAIDYALQMARGLSAAHEKGIIHRDLKPENLFVCKDDGIKILDFGLAKLIRGPENCGVNESRQSEKTQPGALMGTVGYMAPEQVRGQPIDQRSDIFAFGAILYEMLAGVRAFQKPTSADGMAAILTENPRPMAEIGAKVPPALEHLVFRCLEKNPDRRFQSAADLAFSLKALSESGAVSQAFIEERNLTAKAKKSFIAAGLVVIAIGLLGIYLLRHRPPKLTEKDTIVLADLDNKTGDPMFDDALNQALSIQLAQSPFLETISGNKISNTLKLMGRSPGEKLTAELAKEVCVRSGSKAFLQTSLSNFGPQYLLRLTATACVNGERLAESQSEVNSKGGVLKALDSMAAEMRAKLGESITSVQNFDYQGETTTPSLEALKSYSLGVKTLNAHGPSEAIPFFKRAIELDPKFARAYLALGKMYDSLRETKLSADNVTQAYSLARDVSEDERYDIEAEYYTAVTGDLDKALATFDSWTRDYPRNPTPLHNRATILMSLGEYEAAIEGFRQFQRLSPGFIYSDISIAYCNLKLDRFGDAKATLDSLRPSGFDPEYAWRHFYDVAFSQGNRQEMDRQLKIGLARQKDRGDALWSEARTESYYGHFGKVRELSERAISLQVDAGRAEFAASEQGDLARRLSDIGEFAWGKQTAQSALKQEAGRMAQAQAALALVLSGDVAAGKSRSVQLHAAYPADTLLNRYWLSVVNAAVKIKEGRPQDAITLLEPALDYELSWVGPFYPAYLRGQAYLAQGNNQAATTEFQKLIDHHGIVSDDPVGVLVHLQLGRTYAMQGDEAKAKAAYDDFFALWKDADPDIPILKQARIEYAKLAHSI